MARNWAIAIGINQYKNLRSLNYAVRDAELMKQWFENEANFDKVYLFTDNSPEIDDLKIRYESQPNRDNLYYFLRNRFNKPFLKPGDNLWFFFSGHGIRHRNRDFLMPSGVDPHPDAIENSAIPLSYVTERLRRCGADNVVLILDACRDGIDEIGARSGVIGEEKQQGVITIASCSPAEMSYEIKELKQGSFTYSLLQGLRIHGEGNCATVERLDRYLRNRVPEINRSYRKPRQTPYSIAEPVSKYHLILLPDYIQPNLSDISVLRENALEAEAENELKLAEMLWYRLVKFDQDKALKALRRIWLKLENLEYQPTPNALREKKTGAKVATAQVNTSKDISPEKTAVDREEEKLQNFSEQLGNNNITLEMIYIPGGSFMMGSPEGEGYDSEKPQHLVKIQPFFIGKFPVTQAQWQAVMENNPAHFQDNPLNPVERVSWDDAQEFCNALSKKTGKTYRLPTEAEWEYACRAGTTTPYYFGETITKELANYQGNATKQVGSYPPNEFGLYDMHGLVWEWCEDDWHQNYENAPNDGKAWLSKFSKIKVIRGGSWNDDPRDCRSAYRVYLSREDRDGSIGFRVACVAGRTT